MKILLVDPYVVGTECMEDLLREAGQDVLVASDPDGALALSRINDFDLVITAFNFKIMGTLKNGLDLAREMKVGLRKRHPIILYSATFFIENREPGPYIDCVHHKPTTSKGILGAIEESLPGRMSFPVTQ